MFAKYGEYVSSFHGGEFLQDVVNLSGVVKRIEILQSTVIQSRHCVTIDHYIISGELKGGCAEYIIFTFISGAIGLI